MQMDVFEVLKKRRSIRRYQTSADNRQPCHFISVTKPEVKNSLKAAFNADWFLHAPAIIVACVNPVESWRREDGEEYWKVDAAIAMQNLILASTELGLGTCWIAGFDEKAAKKVLNIPKDIRVVAMTPLGYSDEEKGTPTNRKPLDTMLHREKW
jgi:nitroreductase